MKRKRFRCCWPWACALMSLGMPAAAQVDESLAARVKATFLCRVPEFTVWPDTSSRPDVPWTVAIVGRDPHGVATAIESSIAREELKINGRTVAVAKVSYVPPDAPTRSAFEEQLRDCRVLLVTRSEAAHWPDIRQLVAHRAMLVFGEIPQFSRSGGMIEFVVSTRANGTLGIDLHIDLDAVNTAGLRLRSTFLSIRNVLVVKGPNREGAIRPSPDRLAAAESIALLRPAQPMILRRPSGAGDSWENGRTTGSLAAQSSINGLARSWDIGTTNEPPPEGWRRTMHVPES